MSQLSARHTPPMFSRQWEAARDEARDLDRYLADWDGAGADPVPLPLIHATLRLFRKLEAGGFPAPDLVYPAADGTVTVEWHHVGGYVHLASVRKPDRISVIVMKPDGTIMGPPAEPPADATPTSGPAPADGDAFEFSLAA